MVQSSSNGYVVRLTQEIMLDMWVSSISLRSSFPTDFKKWDLDKDKIRLFTEQVKGWQLDIAEYLLFGKDKIPAHGHSAFASLSILMSYFENIYRYMEGITHDRNSRSCFSKGLQNVYQNKSSVVITDDIAKRIYAELRCGLYHVGLTNKNVILSETKPYGVDIQSNGIIAIAPTKLFKEIENHFDKYRTDLKSNSILRNNFQKRFDWVINKDV